MWAISNVMILSTTLKEPREFYFRLSIGWKWWGRINPSLLFKNWRVKCYCNWKQRTMQLLWEIILTFGMVSFSIHFVDVGLKFVMLSVPNLWIAPLRAYLNTTGLDLVRVLRNQLHISSTYLVCPVVYAQTTKIVFFYPGAISTGIIGQRRLWFPWKSGAEYSRGWY